MQKPKVAIPRRARLTVKVTLATAGKMVTREVAVKYPGKLYEFDMKDELLRFVTGFKHAVGAMESMRMEMNQRFLRSARKTKLKRGR